MMKSDTSKDSRPVTGLANSTATTAGGLLALVKAGSEKEYNRSATPEEVADLAERIDLVSVAVRLFEVDHHHRNFEKVDKHLRGAWMWLDHDGESNTMLIDYPVDVFDLVKGETEVTKVQYGRPMLMLKMSPEGYDHGRDLIRDLVGFYPPQMRNVWFVEKSEDFGNGEKEKS